MPRRTPRSTPASAEPPDDNAAPLPLAPADRAALYAARRFIGSSLERTLKIRIPFDVYFQDPLVAAENPKLAFDEDCFVPWEPGLGDGPTSARFAVVDYDGHTETLAAAGPLGQDARRVPRPGRHAARSAQHHGPAVPPGERLGDRAARARLLRKRLRARAARSLGIRGQPADRRAARGPGRERLLRPGQQVAAVLLLRSRRRAHLHLPVDRHHQPRVRPRGARRHPAALHRGRARRRRRRSTSSSAISRPS